ncbi:MupA/Atu3671 family FMN-dependent luciferase-like monooxygenase [Leptothoe sp. ISB3NOV94-8A]|uniref:Mono-oxygenase n=1 Tax=Leptolyngbya sp. ISBN3-Nov-94-8 TaxID=1798139 RepID=A0A125SL32_9CYAN|nr:mono-oxygenase [Leptolyngbya sp. ISBN3-Nov-94-8]
MSTVNQRLTDLFSKNIVVEPSRSSTSMLSQDAGGGLTNVTFSCIFFSDVRKAISNRSKYAFVRELVEFADHSGFEAVCFPERHFHEFGAIYANNAVVAAYFAPLTNHVRLRAAAVSVTLHHPAEIVENWAMVDILSNGRVDLGFGSGWNKPDFVLSPETYENRFKLRDQRIPIIQKLWRGETVDFPGPGGEMFPISVYPRPIQPELNVWYSTFSEQGFERAGSMGYNIFTMLLPDNVNALAKKISRYRQARAAAGFDPETGIVSLLMHTFVHPDMDWVQHVVSGPFKEYIASSVLPQMKAVGKHFNDSEVDRIVDYSYARYLQTGGIFGPLTDCQRQIDQVIAAGVNDIALLQDFGVEYSAVQQSLEYVGELVNRNRESRHLAG